ncbi:MAG TPA: Sec-independent protein translocase protein TatB [Xanthobacteraceae bacterium]|nr:Sec-independent protein translocase protein TatB [Xanthobacteraceae bacterium]
MFDIGWGELLVIGIVALVVIGPKELPGVVRTIGQTVGKLRRMAADFQNQFNEAMREAELADLKKDAEKMIGDVKSVANYNPLEKAGEDLQKTIDEATSMPPAAPAVPPAPEKQDEKAAGEKS